MIGITKNKGFTIVELMVVVLVLGILLAIAIPNILRVRALTESAQADTELKVIYVSLVMYQCDTGKYPKSWSDLETYLDVSKFQDKYEINQN